jgi:uncharacterized membrane protein YfcA
MVDWNLAVLFVLGGVLGGFAGIKLAGRLAAQRRMLTIVFSAIVAVVGCYVALRGFLSFA